jgi:hypothetical protein
VDEAGADQRPLERESWPLPPSAALGIIHAHP